MDVHDNLGAQVGDNNSFTVNVPAVPVAWPVRVGVVPPMADRYQHRSTEARLASPERTSGVVLSGLGGVGKSQLAARYARSVWQDESMDLVMWIGAGTRAGVITSYATAANRVLPDQVARASSPEEAATALLSWLGSTQRRWLIVLDDLQDPEDLRELWPPQTSSGQVVVTTRRRDSTLARGDRELIEVGVFSEAESLAYLTAKLPAHAGDDQLRELTNDLHHLPLALAQAAAFIADKPLLTVAAYRDRLTKHRKTLAQVMQKVPDEHQATVAATWSLSIERADSFAPQGLARPLLELISLLDPDGVPVDAFTTPEILAHLTLGRTAVDADQVADALGNLHRLNLITLDPTQPARTVQIHALVQRAVRDTLTTEQLTNLVRMTADALLSIWPKIETDAALAQALRSATDTLHAHTDFALWKPAGHALLFRAGRSLGEAGLLTPAIAYFRQLHDHAVDRLGPDHPDTLIARHNLAHWRAESGDVTRTVTEYTQLLTDCLRILGPDHPDTLSARHSLAYWQADAGDVARAITELEQLLTDYVRVLGLDHPDTMITRGNLAHWRAEAGNVAEAITELEQLLTDRHRVLGPNHPKTLFTRHSLAHRRAKSGDVHQAISEFEQLLTDRLRVLGADHPDTLFTRNNLTYWRDQVE